MERKHKGMFFELDYGKDVKIDLKDKKILSVLGENCRTTIKNIGKAVNLGKDSVRYRINQLIKKDLYRGNVVILNPFILGISLDTLLIKLEKIHPEKEEEFIDFLEDHPFIVWAGQTHGSYDYVINMASIDIKHFDKLLKEIRLKLHGHIKELKILHLTKVFSCNTIPTKFKNQMDTNIEHNRLDTSFGSLLNKIPDSSLGKEKVKPDKTDLLIVDTIANKANMTIQEISEETGIKPDTIKNRIAKLIEANVILAFRGSINVSYLNFHGYVSLFKLYPHSTEAQRKEFENYLKNSDFVSFGTETVGSYYDFQIYIFANDPLEFNRIKNELKHKFSDIIEDNESVLILKDYQFTFLPKGIITPFKKLLLKVASYF
jgi:DNA-binding Lrp family transcriptional regulator